MIMGFKPHFVASIKGGSKIHSIRKGNRWKEGMKIHCATGVRTKEYNQFDEKMCVSVQNIKMEWLKPFSEQKHLFITIDNHTLSIEEMEVLSQNDGFEDLEDFFEWFSEDFDGQIIHWTDFKY